MTANGAPPDRRPSDDEPAGRLLRDVCDLADAVIAKISDADVDENLRRLLEQADKRPDSTNRTDTPDEED